MIDFQELFSTIEQSKRLLQAGLPIDSANCFYKQDDEVHIIPKGFTYTNWVSDGYGRIHDYYFPCWSIGRLIDISKKCFRFNNEFNPILESIKNDISNDQIENFVVNFETYQDKFDYSRLVEPITK